MRDKTSITYSGEINDKTGMALGGLGTGTLTLDLAGRFQQVRTQNNWVGRLGATPAGNFFSIRAERGGQSVGRVLQLKQEGELPRVSNLDYHGDFPFLNIDYKDAALPCEVSLEAFSPMIPHDADSSSLPLVFFTFKLRNFSKEKVKVSLAFSWQNDIAIWTHRKYHNWPSLGKYNQVVASPAVGALMSTRETLLRGSEYLIVGIPSEGVEYAAVADWWNIKPLQCAGPDFDNGNGEHFKFAADNAGALALWRPFLESGELPAERSFDDHLGEYSYHSPTGAVAGKADLSPGEEKEIRFAMCWFFPYHLDGSGHYVGHWYAKRFPGGAREIAAFGVERFEDSRRRSAEWKKLISNATLPETSLKFLSNILYLLPRITWRLEDGRFLYYESIDCTRMFAVLLEQYAAPVMAAFFPELHAKALRYYAKFQLESGEIPTTLGFCESVHTPEFRVFSPNDVSAFVLSIYNNLMWDGDKDFADAMYPNVKKTLKWGLTLDVDGDGVPDCHGIDQGCDTWPMWGAVSYIADLWLAALKAGEKMATIQHDDEFSEWCQTVFRKASATVENDLWNGEYYDISYNRRDGARCDTSFMDQFAGQTWGWMLGLDDIHPRERVETAVKSIFRNNVELAGEFPLSGAKRGGVPDCSSEHNKQSRAFVPCSIASFCANAARNGEYDRATRLFDKTADFIVNREQEPWLAQLLFDAADGKYFYGTHYVDLLMIWDVLHAVTGHRVNALDGTLTLAPPKIPARGPIFTTLFFGEAEYTRDTISLRSASEKATQLKRVVFIDPDNGDERIFENLNVGSRATIALSLNS